MSFFGNANLRARRSSSTGVGAMIGLFLAAAATAIAAVAAVLTHIFYTFGALLDATGTAVIKPALVLLIGVAIPFLGAFHGLLIWFGSGVV